jgi:hypothetical protein
MQILIQKGLERKKNKAGSIIRAILGDFPQIQSPLLEKR